MSSTRSGRGADAADTADAGRAKAAASRTGARKADRFIGAPRQISRILPGPAAGDRIDFRVPSRPQGAFMNRKLVPAVALLAVLAPLALAAEEPVDLAMMTRIRDEGLHHSQVMETLYQLTDRNGARLTGSPQLKRANDWTRDQFTKWGLVNAHLEGYPFGRGWEFSACQVRMVAPRTAVLLAYPKAWTPGTSGPVRGGVVRVKVETPADLEAYRGKVTGKILLLD